MLEVCGIDVRYGDVQVIYDLSFAVAKGEIVALIGANGAGKSTTLKAIAGLLPIHRGQVLYDGRDLASIEPHRRIEHGIVMIPEARRLFAEMSVEENLDVGALRGESKRVRAQTKEWVFGIFPRLKERRRQSAGSLSGGEQQMLAVGRGLMGKPRLMILDEPSLGLAPILVRDIFDVVRSVREEGVTLLLVEQNVKRTLTIVDRAYVLENGRITLQGTGKQLLDDEHVRSAYLGV
ncbi:MAG: ABC transporter ATP-binding protein [Candidatus Eisenbacteria bacterium]|nr:ABC transporter ATP-binding protein [Candidatus Eisenbacteria bacterium]